MQNRIVLGSHSNNRYSILLQKKGTDGNFWYWAPAYFPTIKHNHVKWVEDLVGEPPLYCWELSKMGLELLLICQFPNIYWWREWKNLEDFGYHRLLTAEDPQSREVGQYLISEEEKRGDWKAREIYSGIRL